VLGQPAPAGVSRTRLGLAISMPVAGVIAMLVAAGRYELDRVTWALLATMLALAVLQPQATNRRSLRLGFQRHSTRAGRTPHRP
jgi:hypothetical protein